MSIGDEPAFPGEYQTLSPDGKNIVIRQCPGLTKRELFAALIASGAAQYSDGRDDHEAKPRYSPGSVAAFSGETANALLARLDKEAEGQ